MSVHDVVDVVRRMRDLGCDEIDIADTIGVGTPARVQEVMRAASMEFAIDRLGPLPRYLRAGAVQHPGQPGSGHRHLPRVRGGLGGCPYAKGATGNVATEDVLYMLHGMGLHTGIDLEAVVRTGDYISQANRPPQQPARVAAPRRDQVGGGGRRGGLHLSRPSI